MNVSIPLGIGSVSAEIELHGNNPGALEMAAEIIGEVKVEAVMEEVIEQFGDDKSAQAFRLSFGDDYSKMLADAENGDTEAGAIAEVTYETKQACERLTA